MSFSKKERNFRAETGHEFSESDRMTFTIAIARALDQEFRATPGKIKVVARLTGANERTVKNWFYAKNGPSGESLVELMRHSTIVLQLVLHQAGRQDLLNAMQVISAREQLRSAITTLDALLGDDGNTAN